MANTSHRRPRGLASTTLKGAGLINVADRDEKMYDLTKSTQGGRKSQPRNKKIGHRQRAVDIYKTSGTTDPQKMVNVPLFDWDNRSHPSTPVLFSLCFD